jgi:hypothetical protein
MKKNVAGVERYASVLAGAWGLQKVWRADHADAPGARALRALGGVAALGLLLRGASGRCAVKRQLTAARGTDGAQADRRTGTGPFEASVLVNKRVHELRDTLRRGTYSDFEVKLGADDGAEQVATAHFAEHDWSVELTPAYGGKQTRLTVRTTLDAEPRSLSQRLVGMIASGAFAPLVMSELRRLKALIETGEIATIEGQPNGERSSVGRAVERAVEAAKGKASKLIQAGASGLGPAARQARETHA